MGTREVTRNGLTFRVLEQDNEGWHQYWDAYESGQWNVVETDVLDNLHLHGGWFVDVGAWIGPMTLYAAALGSKVLAIEPDPVARLNLIANVRKNRFHRRVTISADAIVEGPLGEKEMRRVVPIEGGEYGDGMSHLGSTGTAWVYANTIPNILEQHRINEDEVWLTKIDVEGYERRLMPTLGPWLAERRIPFRVAYHGEIPEMSWFAGYHNVEIQPGERMNSKPWGEVLAVS